MLASLHLGGRPVDRVDLRLGCRERAEEVVGRPAVRGFEVVAVYVVDERAIPLGRRLDGNLTADERAAAAVLNPRAIVLGGSLSTVPAFVEGLSTRLQRLTLDAPEVVAVANAPLEGASFEVHRRAREALGF